MLSKERHQTVTGPLKREHGLTAEQAYTLASVAVDLRVGQVVDVPNYIVTAVLNMDVFSD